MGLNSYIYEHFFFMVSKIGSNGKKTLYFTGMQYGIPQSLIDFAVFYTMEASILGTVGGIAHRDEDFLAFE